MRLSWNLGWAALALSTSLGVFGAGCSDAEDAAESPRIGVPGVDATVAFEHDGTLTMAPGETVSISVVGKPAKPYAIKLLLVGDSLDASLDRTDVVADEDGRATVTLRAPNTATYFAVRATIKDGPSANLSVAVSDQGFGTLTVLPDYAGKRNTVEWVASVVTGSSCDALKPTFPNDPEGPEPVTADEDEPIVIEDVPVGPNLAVFVRGGHYMWGCADKSDLVANETVKVIVKIRDKPLDLGGANLEVSLGMAPNDQEWGALVATQRSALIDAFLGRVTESAMLLSAMEASYAGDPQAFAAASTDNDWLTQIDAHWLSNDVDLAAALATFVDDGLLDEPSEIQATLTGVDDAPAHAVLTLLSIGSASPAVMNVPEEYVMSFTADPDDTVRLGGTLFWMPSRYFGYVAEQAALAQYANNADLSGVLAELAACETLALPGLDGCDDVCVADLCAAALSQRWEHALASSAESLSWGELPFESSGASRFDDAAVVTGFSGSWLGQFVAGNQTAKVVGDAEAEKAGERSAE